MTNILDGESAKPALRVIEGGSEPERLPFDSPPGAEHPIPGVSITLSGYVAVDVFGKLLGEGQDAPAVMVALMGTLDALQREVGDNLELVIERWGFSRNADLITVGVFPPPGTCGTPPLEPPPPGTCG